MMGRSIHYALTTTLTDTEAVRKLVEDMRRLALGLSFERVGPLIEIVNPHPLLCFPVWPGKGCEPATFLRCHLAVISLLDAIRQAGLAGVTVKDDGEYWERSDLGPEATPR
jgi:hypothetical protein